MESEPAEFLLQPSNGARPKIVPVKEPVLGASNNSDTSVSKLPDEAVALERLNGMDRMKNKMDEVFAQNNGSQNKVFDNSHSAFKMSNVHFLVWTKKSVNILETIDRKTKLVNFLQ